MVNINSSLGKKNSRSGMVEENFVANFLNKVRTNPLYSSYRKFKVLSNNSKTDISDGYWNIQVKKYTSKLNQKTYMGGQIGKMYLKYLCDNIGNEYSDVIEDILDPFFNAPVINGICDTSNRIMLDELNKDDVKQVLDALEKCKRSILELILLGPFEDTAPDFFCCVKYINKDRSNLTIYNMKSLINYLCKSKFEIRENCRSRIYLGDALYIQRKGGDNGRKGANNVQFRIVIDNIGLKPLFEHRFG